MTSLAGNAWFAGAVGDSDAVQMLLPRPPGEPMYGSRFLSPSCNDYLSTYHLFLGARIFFHSSAAIAGEFLVRESDTTSGSYVLQVSHPISSVLHHD